MRGIVSLGSLGLFLAALVLVAAPGSLGCRGAAATDAGLSPVPVVLGGSDQEAPVSAADPWWKSILSQCREAAGDEDSERLANLLRMVEGRPVPSWAQSPLSRFRALLRATLLVQEGTLRTFFVLARPDYATGETIWLRLRLENRSDTEVFLPAPGGEGMVRSEMLLMDQWATGRREQRKEMLSFPLGKPLVLASGEVLEVGFEPITASLGRGVVLRTARFEGRLLLGKIVSGREELPLTSIPVGPTLLRIFPAGFEPIRAEPLITLRRSLELSDRKHFPHIFLSAFFLRTGRYAQEAIQEASSLLVAKLDELGETGDPLEAVLKASLKELSGQEEFPDQE